MWTWHVWIIFGVLCASIPICISIDPFRPVYSHHTHSSFWAVPVPATASGDRGSTTRVGNSWIARERFAERMIWHRRVYTIWLHIGRIRIEIYRIPMTMTLLRLIGLYQQFIEIQKLPSARSFIFTARDYALLATIPYTIWGRGSLLKGYINELSGMRDEKTCQAASFWTIHSLVVARVLEHLSLFSVPEELPLTMEHDWEIDTIFYGKFII